MKSDEEKAADEMLILRLLAGYHVDRDGREITSYLEPNSWMERKARKLLAAQLREGSVGYLTRELLALAIDPETPSTYPGLEKPTRKVRFESPARGKPSTWVRDLAVIHRIKKSVSKGASNEEATAEAGDHYRMERSRVREIWTKWRKLVR